MSRLHRSRSPEGGDAASWRPAPGRTTLTQKIQRKEANDKPPATGATPAAAPAKDDAYVAGRFVSEFEPILNVFPELPKRPDAKPIDPALIMANWDTFYAQNQAEAAWLNAVAAKLKTIFSSKQLALIVTFVETRILPDGLFTDTKITDTASAGTIAKNASQRIMMSTHMLAKGRKKDGDATDSVDAPGKVKGDNCGHWAEMAWIYAGAQSSLGDPGGNEGSKLNSTGPTGKTSFGGGGKNDYVYGGFSTKETAKAKKEADATGVETLESGGGAGRKDPLGAPDPKAMFAALKSLVPGDWVWIDNRADSEGHSFIFAGWQTEPVEGSYLGPDGKAHPTASGTCFAYSQRSNWGTEELRRKKSGDWAKDGGGDRHTEPIGYPFSFSPQRYPVTQICKPAADAGPAHTEKELLHYKHEDAMKKNAGYIKSAHLDRAKYHAAMVKAARAGLAAAKDFDEGLRELCGKVLADHEADDASADACNNLTVLIALVQRMNPTNAVLGPNGKGVAGRPVRGWLNPSEKTDMALVPGGLDGIKTS